MLELRRTEFQPSILRRLFDILSQKGGIAIGIASFLLLLGVVWLSQVLFVSPRVTLLHVHRFLRENWALEGWAQAGLLGLIFVGLILAIRRAAGSTSSRRRGGWFGVMTLSVGLSVSFLWSAHRAERALLEKPPMRVDPSAHPWFDGHHGTTKLWYFEHENGDLEFYDRAGVHERSRGSLQPVTPELHERWRHERLVVPEDPSGPVVEPPPPSGDLA